jgi:hypothetical protein
LITPCRLTGADDCFPDGWQNTVALILRHDLRYQSKQEKYKKTMPDDFHRTSAFLLSQSKFG